eukprot:m.264620 g.264620  ORF g.264620 m.264620 type:complete len:64 (-) comp15619_c0_seq1:3-194(-)
MLCEQSVKPSSPTTHPPCARTPGIIDTRNDFAFSADFCWLQLFSYCACVIDSTIFIQFVFHSL